VGVNRISITPLTPLEPISPLEGDDYIPDFLKRTESGNFVSGTVPPNHHSGASNAAKGAAPLVTDAAPTLDVKPGEPGYVSSQHGAWTENDAAQGARIASFNAIDQKSKTTERLRKAGFVK
jgi:hypothetical protein